MPSNVWHKKDSIQKVVAWARALISPRCGRKAAWIPFWPVAWTENR